MSTNIFNHSEIYNLLLQGNTAQAINLFIKKTNPEDFSPFLRNSYLSSLNFGIYNFILLNKKLSLHECCMENERKILQTTNSSFISTGIEIISSYENDTSYIIEQHSNPYIRAAISYIHAHLSEPLTLEVISNIIHMNSAYFCDLFKKEVGCCFIEYIQRQRVQTAKNLLSNTALSIQEISESCGFCSAGYFSTCFKKYEKISPSKYKSISGDN